MPLSGDVIGQLSCDDFVWGDKLGQGTFGIVSQAVFTHTLQDVAVKKCYYDNDSEGVPPTAIREISALLHMQHANIVKLHDVFFSDGCINLVFEQCDSDLKQYLRRTYGGAAPPDETRELFRQLIRGLACCHLGNMFHRDLKPQNLLVHVATRTLKIADFGISRVCHDRSRAYTPEVCTLWYRPPETLLGCPIYDSALDIWSCGCILAEIATGNALFQGDSEIGQIFAIMKYLGKPCNDRLADNVHTYKFWYPDTFPNFKGVARQIEPHSANLLLNEILQFNPKHRPSTCDIERHSYLREQLVHPTPPN